MEIHQDDLTNPQTQALVRLHFEDLTANTPCGKGYVLALEALQVPNITVWSAWEGERICGIGALKQLDAEHGELKSMRTHPDFLRRGVAAALLESIMAEARARGLHRLSLETGRGSAFEPALKLYRRHGFCDGAAFADYQPNGFSNFLHLDLV